MDVVCKAYIIQHSESTLISFLKSTISVISGVIKLHPFSESQKANFVLLRRLVRRDLEKRYKGSIVGIMWPLVTQLSRLLIYTYIFSVIFGSRGDRGLGDDPLTYGLWLFGGILPWWAFANGVTRATSSVIRQSNLVKKVVFPLGLIPLVAVFSSFLESIFGLFALFGMTLFLSRPIPPTAFLLPIVWLPQLLLTCGLGYVLASLSVFLRDIPNALSIILNLWFYLTPIIYPIELVPERLVDFAYWLNPMVLITQTHRNIVLFGVMEQWGHWFVILGINSLICFLGYKLYKKLSPVFSDVL